MNGQRVVKRAVQATVALLLLLALGTACHEMIGHGLTGVLLGGRITFVEVLGLELWPEFGWGGWPGAYGHCGVADVPTPARGAVVNLAGSMSTWAVSVIAVLLLWLHRWRGFARFILIGLSIWWIDLLTYTLPSWGLRRSILWGPVYSEPYEAATGLGIPGWAFQAFAVVSSVLLVGATWIALRRSSGPPGQQR